MKADYLFSQSALLLTLLAASIDAVAMGAGTIVMNGKSATVTDAYAYRQPAANDKAVVLTTIVLTDRPLDSGKLAENEDRDKTIHALLKRARAVYWEAVLLPDGTLKAINAVWPGGIEIRGRVDNVHLRITHSDAQRIEGTYRTLDEAPKELLPGGEYFDLKFSTDF